MEQTIRQTGGNVAVHFVSLSITGLPVYLIFDRMSYHSSVKSKQQSDVVHLAQANSTGLSGDMANNYVRTACRHAGFHMRYTRGHNKKICNNQHRKVFLC